MKRSRKLALAVAVAAVIGIPGAALADGGPSNCVGQSVQMMRTTFMSHAHSEPGAVGDLIASFRTDPAAYPWCA